MLHALLHNKLKDSFVDPHFKPSEDSFTSSVIGLMQYLPDTVFWQLLRGSCGTVSALPEDVGEILFINFWKKMLPDGKHNSVYIEPDVWIECEKYDIIIEAKKYDDSDRQDREQWEKEIISFNKTFSENDKELIFIALGGNTSLQDRELTINDKLYTIYTSSWYKLLHEIDRYKQSFQFADPTRETKGYLRLLNDLIAVFAKHNHFSMNWLSSMAHKRIDQNSTSKISSLWEFDNKAVLQNFYKSATPIICNNIFEIWEQK